MTENKTQLPPQDLEAEKAVISYALTGHAHEVHHAIRPHCFYSNKHQEIMMAIDRLILNGESVDNVTVLKKLKENNTLDSCGGHEYLLKLLEAKPTETLESYTKKIIDTRYKRDIARFLNETISMIYSDQPIYDLDEILDHIKCHMMEYDI